VERDISIRLRLTVWYAFVVAAGLTVFAGLVWISLRRDLINEVDEQLKTRANSFEMFLNRELNEEPTGKPKEELEEFCKSLPALSNVRLHGVRDNFEFSCPAGEWLPEGTANSSRPAYVNVHWRGHSYRVFRRQITVQNARYALEMAWPLDAVEHVLNVLETMLLSLVPAIILVACAGGVWLSRRALKPVDAMTLAARSISLDRLSSRLPVPQTRDELQRLAEAWNTMLGRLETAVNKVLHFAADASHELRTPLAIIQTSAELALRKSRTPEQYRESLGQIMTESARMTQLVEDLLVLARSDASAAEMPMELDDVSKVIRTVCSEMQEMADLRQITIRRSMPDAPVFIRGNKPALHRLFLVLLDNAIKYSEPNSAIDVLVQKRGDRHDVTIKDSGAGISPRDLPHIFERFYRSDKTRTHFGGGHGLGLALAESIARRHRATISVESSLGHGSEFRVSFPAEHDNESFIDVRRDSSDKAASCEPATGARADLT
jgi:heavy metal sensor kinase